MTQRHGHFNEAADLGRKLGKELREAKVVQRRATVSSLRNGPAPIDFTKFAHRQLIAQDIRTSANVGNVDGPAGIRFNASEIAGYSSGTTATFRIKTDGSGFLGTGATQITWGTDGSVEIPGGAIEQGTIDELQLADRAVTNAKIAVDAIQGDVIAAAAITETKIATDAISTPKIKAGAITTAKLDAGAVTAAKIEAGAVTADKIQAGAVTAEKITVANLAAIKSDLGSITAGTVTGATIRSASSGDRVQLDTGGLKIIGDSQLFQFLDSGGTVEAAIVLNSSDQLEINGDLVIPDVGGTLQIGSDALPFLNATFDLGSSTKRWVEGWIEELHGSGGSIKLTKTGDLRPHTNNLHWIGTSSFYYDQIHVATGGLIEHSPRKFSRPARELVRAVTHDAQGRILVPEEFRGSERDHDGRFLPAERRGTRIGHVAYAVLETTREHELEIEALKAELAELRRQLAEVRG